MIPGVATEPRPWVDSDFREDEGDEDWASQIDTEVLQTLSDSEKKRQEIINGELERLCGSLSTKI